MGRRAGICGALGEKHVYVFCYFEIARRSQVVGDCNIHRGQEGLDAGKLAKAVLLSLEGWF